MVHIQQDGVGGTCEAQPAKGLGITAAHVHQRKQNGEWKGGEGSRRARTLRVGKRGGRRGNEDLLLMVLLGWSGNLSH